MNGINLTINATTKVVTIAFLKSDNTTVVGTHYRSFSYITDEIDGWVLDPMYTAERNNKIFFSQIVNLNGSAIGATTQSQVTALLVAAISV